MTTDCVQRFLFEELDIRGAVVRLEAVWAQLLARRDYPPRVIELLGEMGATTVLLADNLKQVASPLPFPAGAAAAAP